MSVFIISAGMNNPKKRDHILARRQHYLNYGALTLASIIDKSGLPVTQFHGQHQTPETIVELLARHGAFTSKYPLLLSITSFYALEWARDFCTLVKNENSKVEIYVGGRWVIGSDIKWISEKLPLADKIIPGLAEDFILRLIHKKPLNFPSAEKISIPNLNHQLVHNYKHYQPSVDISRGCGMGCSFCEERDIPLSPLKDPKTLVHNLQEIITQYDNELIKPYFQSSFFLPSKNWADNFAAEMHKSKTRISWRCETRVDAMKPSTVAALAASGLKVIDLGLETASIQQIINMNKSKNPDRYLRAASDLIRSCKDHGVWVKVNFLLYAGETITTFNETIEWLDSHRDCIKGISVGPVVVFGSPFARSEFVNSIETLGGKAIHPKENDFGVTHIHLSSEIDRDLAESLSLQASRRYMTSDDYFDLKSFSYYSRYYTKDDFADDLASSNPEKLPFSITNSN